MSKEKKFINLPGQPFYRYDDEFKKKVVSDLEQGLISERKAARLYRFDRKNIAKWKKAFGQTASVKQTESQKIKLRSDSVSVSGVIALNQEVKLLKQQLAHEKLRSEALMTIIEVAELDLQIPIQKKPLPQQSKK